MKPGTFHYVLTLEPSLVYGQHFYSLPHIRRTVQTLAHALFKGTFITNTDHIRLLHVILRLMPFWYECYQTNKIDPSKPCMLLLPAARIDDLAYSAVP